MGVFFATALLAVVASCTWRTSVDTSILVILVEDLRFGAFSCGEGSESGRRLGFQAFCDEAVRFTHAFAPSTLSQATFASVLTAKYPFEHSVRHNGAQSLSSKEELFSEVALAKGYRTAFFSGGPPLWRRSGLNQGFEVYDDNLALNLRSIYRAAPSVVKLFLGWQESEAAREKFVSFLFFSDLQFADVPTLNELGELRESSYRSQLDAVDESLSTLIKEMKKRKVWDSTDVFLIGLQGPRPLGLRGIGQEEIPTLNLFSEATRATLMIKPARKTRDGPFNWKIDAGVSLVDAGATLFDLLGSPRTREGGGEALVHSLRSALTGPQPDWSWERPIVSESAWSQWRGFGGVRAAVRRGPYLYLFDEFAQLFNTLTDSPETIPLPSTDPRAIELRASFAGFLKSKGYLPWKPLSRAEIEKADLAAELWRDREPSREILHRLKELAERSTEDLQTDFQLQGWRAIWALKRRDWEELKEAAAAVVPEQKTWAFIAARNLGEKSPDPGEPCFQFLKTAPPNASPPKECRLEGLSELLAWSVDSQPESVRNKSMEAFYRIYLPRVLATRIAEQNNVLARKWDTAMNVEVPDPLDLVLALPEFKKQRALVNAKIETERSDPRLFREPSR